MKEKIINRVNSSPLILIDLEEFYPKNKMQVFDISLWLDQGFVLREKEFREKAKNFNWEKFRNQFVAIKCESKAIIPSWASMLVSMYLNRVSKKVVYGSIENLKEQVFNDIISKIDFNKYKNKPVIIKGCTNKKIPENAYIQLFNRLQLVAKSIFYGEACSAVPLFKTQK